MNVSNTLVWIVKTMMIIDNKLNNNIGGKSC